MTRRISTSPSGSATKSALAPIGEFFPSRGFHVNDSGDVEVVLVGDTASTVFKGLQAGAMVPYAVKELISGDITLLDSSGEEPPVAPIYIQVDGEDIFVDGEKIQEA